MPYSALHTTTRSNIIVTETLPVSRRKITFFDGEGIAAPIRRAEGETVTILGIRAIGWADFAHEEHIELTLRDGDRIKFFENVPIASFPIKAEGLFKFMVPLYIEKEFLIDAVLRKSGEELNEIRITVYGIRKGSPKR